MALLSSRRHSTLPDRSTRASGKLEAERGHFSGSSIIAGRSNDPDFNNSTFAPKTGDLDGGPSRVGFSDIFRTDSTEGFEVRAQIDVVAGHLHNGAEVQPAFL